MLSYEETIQKMRKVVMSSDWPIPYDQWTKDGISRCQSFALSMPNGEFQDFFQNYFGSGKDNVKLLEQLLKDLNLSPRKIFCDEMKNPEEFVIVLYDFIHYAFDYPIWSIHFARVEQDGTWVTKHGLNSPKVSSYEMNSIELFNLFGKFTLPAALFAITKPN